MTVPANSGGQEPTAGSGQQGQEPTGAQGQTEPTQQGQDGGQEPQTGQQGAQTLDPSKIEDPALRAYVERVQRDAAEARREAASYRTRAQEAQGKVQEYERANETEQQRVERERAELQAERDRLAQENADLRVGTAVKAAATEARAFDPDLIYSMVKEQVTTGPDGQPTNLDQVLNDLKRDRPFLFRRTDAGAGEGTGDGQPPGTGGGINDFIRGRATAGR